MEARSRKVPMGRVFRRTSRKRRSTAFAVRTRFRPSGAGFREAGGEVAGVVAQAFDSLRIRIAAQP